MDIPNLDNGVVPAAVGVAAGAALLVVKMLPFFSPLLSHTLTAPDCDDANTNVPVGFNATALFHRHY
jgi:hypothetical protein